jgi:anti-sigma B factor antagonist
VSKGSDAPLRERPVLGVDAVGGGVVVRLGGELDLYNADQVRAALAAATDDSPAFLVVDLSQVEFVDSTALSVFIEARSKLGEGALRLAAPQLETMRALKVSGLDRHLAVFDDVDAAVAG